MPSPAAERFLTLPWLSELDQDARLALLEVLKEDRAPTGTPLAQQGVVNEALSFLIDGGVTLTRTYPDGRVERIANLSAPAVFGESSFFSRNPSLVSTHTTSPSWRLTLDHSGHETLRQNHPRAAELLALAAVRLLSERFDILDKRVSELVFEHPKATELSRFRARLLEEAIL